MAEVAADLRKRVKSDVEKITANLNETGKVLIPRIEKKKNNLIKHLACVEDEVNASTDKLIAQIQQNRQKLLAEVDSIRQKRVKPLETVKEEVEQHMAALESLKRYSETLLSSGTDCDVTKSANSLHDRADELIMFDVISHVNSSLPFVSDVTVTFEPMPSSVTLGSVTERYTAPARVTHVIPEGNYVGAVASLGDDVFVVRQNSQEIEVYDVVAFTLNRRIAVPGLGINPYGLAACARNKCLYLSDRENSCIHRTEILGNNAVMKWFVASNPMGLIVNEAENVVVASQSERKLQEFTTRGTLLRNIQMPGDIEKPRGIIEVRDGQFVVSYEGTLHRVCLMEARGWKAAVLCRYGKQRGSSLTQMDRPGGLAEDKQGNILIAEEGNNRLLVLNSSLTNAHVMPVPVDGGLNGPFALCYDKSRGRLYIGEYMGGRVIIIDDLNNFNRLPVIFLCTHVQFCILIAPELSAQTALAAIVELLVVTNR